MESFFPRLKIEMVYSQKYRNLPEAAAYITNYIRFYNSERLHSGLNYLTPVQVASVAAWWVSIISG
jgi:putative transposase